MAEIFEALMVICFGISWPTSILKSYKSKTASGKSILFLIFIFCGYGFGIVSKLFVGNINYVLMFYVINIIMVSIDMILYVRNRIYDRQRRGENID